MPAEVLGTDVARARPVLWRITDRATFDELRRRGQRARQGPLTVTFLAPTLASTPSSAPASVPDGADQPPRVAFAIGKAAAGAVVRNRIRRRLRAALRGLRSEGALPTGAYLVAVGAAGASVATMPWAELRSLLRHTVTEASR